MLKGQAITWTIRNKSILQDINIEIKRGECLGLIGPNGSGKSSLLKILAFLQKPSSGKIFFEGYELSQKIPLTIHRRIAIVFQESLLLDTDVFHNMAIGLKIRKLPQKAICSTIEYWLDAFKISHLIKQQARFLSGGEAQRVSLARAFALNPDILFLDEPFSSLDAPTTEDILYDLSRIFSTTGITTLIVSHNFREIKHLTNRTIVMFNGRIQASGVTSELFSTPQNHDIEGFLKYML